MSVYQASLHSHISLRYWALLFLFQSGSLAASSDESRARVASAERTLAWAANIVRVRGGIDAQLALESVSLRVIHDVLPAPRVGRRHPTERFQVIIPDAYIELLKNCAEINILAALKTGLQSDVLAYVEYMNAVNVANRDNQRLKKTIEPIDSPFKFASSRTTHAALLRCYPIDESVEFQRDCEAGNTLVFTLLHELGHVLRNHQPFNERTLAATGGGREGEEFFLKDLAQLRRQEAEADEWAARQMLRMGAEPFQILNTCLMQVLVASSGFDTNLERLDSHPVGLNRAVSILAEIRRSYKDFRGQPLPTEIDLILSGIETLSQEATEKFDRLERERLERIRRFGPN